MAEYHNLSSTVAARLDLFVTLYLSDEAALSSREHCLHRIICGLQGSGCADKTVFASIDSKQVSVVKLPSPMV